MKVFVFNEEIYLIKLNKITIYIDNEIFAFLGKKTNEKIKIKTDTDLILRYKFKISYWDDCNDLSHIKFLVKYSPILSKFVDLTEFDTIEFVPSSDSAVGNWPNISYIKFNDGKEFFNVYDIAYIGQDIICLKVDSEFLKILERR